MPLVAAALCQGDVGELSPFCRPVGWLGRESVVSPTNYAFLIGEMGVFQAMAEMPGVTSFDSLSDYSEGGLAAVMFRLLARVSNGSGKRKAPQL